VHCTKGFLTQWTLRMRRGRGVLGTPQRPPRILSVHRVKTFFGYFGALSSPFTVPLAAAKSIWPA